MGTLLIPWKGDFHLEVSLLIKATGKREHRESSELPFMHFGIPLASLGLQRAALGFRGLVARQVVP